MPLGNPSRRIGRLQNQPQLKAVTIIPPPIRTSLLSRLQNPLLGLLQRDMIFRQLIQEEEQKANPGKFGF